MRFIPATRALAIVAGLICMLVIPVLAQNPVRILILPFNINASSEFAYLQEGIYDMLVSRIAAVPDAEIIERDTVMQSLQTHTGPITAGTAASLGESLYADYVVYGSLTLFGESISTDAHLYDRNKQSMTVTLNQTGNTHGELIAHVNRFADQIKASAFGLAVATAPPAPAPAPTPAPAPQTPAQPQSPQTGAVVQSPTAGGVESGLSTEPVTAVPFAIVKSRRFKTEIMGLTVADVDGDKNKELVFIDDTNVYVYQYEEERFKRLKEIKSSRSHKQISVDAADINANGRAEIFVTSAQKGTFGLNSYVLEWDSNAFVKIIKHADWYFRVTHAKDRSDLLLGQKRAERSVFLATRYELGWKSNEYKARQTLSLPDEMNIFGLAFGNLTNSGGKETVGFTYKDRILILAGKSNELWSSDAPYGGRATYLEAQDYEGDRLGEYRELKRVYLPQRILVSDLDKDGIDEIVSVNNKAAGGRLFNKARVFNNGVIECLGWDGYEMTTKWKTREFKDYISDYAIGDLDNDNSDELIFAVIDKKRNPRAPGQKHDSHDGVAMTGAWIEMAALLVGRKRDWVLHDYEVRSSECGLRSY